VRRFFESYPKVIATIFIATSVMRLFMRGAPRIQHGGFGISPRFFEPVTGITLLGGVAFLVFMFMISGGFALRLLRVLIVRAFL
jgi:hypothetical protein